MRSVAFLADYRQKDPALAWYHTVMSKIMIVGELWRFMNVRKKWCFLPIIVIITLFGILLLSAQASPFAPFIYSFI